MTDEQKRALPYVNRGNEQLGQGNIAAARLFYQRAAEAGLAQGALALAATYDPVELERIGARFVQADTQAARKWYERARELGATEADERLKQLGSR
jgi:TPR repeat protein